MRVVSGTARGRRLVAPAGTEVRPTTDRVREALFNSLHSMGAVEGARVLDLFAGSGALGIEALSRGAAHCTFVDASPRAIEAVRANLDTTGFGGQASVRRGDALEVLRAAPAAGDGAFDLVLADPPYGFDRWQELLGAVPAPLVVVESDRPVEPPPGWSVLRERSYGTTVLAIMAAPGRNGARAEDSHEGDDHQ